MARCEDCIHGEFCRFICYTRTVLVGGNAEKRCKYFKLAADFVPKSEISETVEKIVSATDKVICEAKSEVAREIFEEIESILNQYTFEDDYISLGVTDEFAELKKKYTEPVHCKDCQHLVFSDCYGECGKGHKGIVNPNDTCEHGVKKHTEEKE